MTKQTSTTRSSTAWSESSSSRSCNPATTSRPKPPRAWASTATPCGPSCKTTALRRRKRLNFLSPWEVLLLLSSQPRHHRSARLPHGEVVGEDFLAPDEVRAEIGDYQVEGFRNSPLLHARHAGRSAAGVQDHPRTQLAGLP